jgi:hypothetical protein
MAFSPLPNMHAHIQTQYVRNVTETHRPEGGVRDGHTSFFRDQVFSAPIRQKRDPFAETYHRKFSWLRYQETIELTDNLSLCVAERFGVVGLSVSNISHDG